MHLVHVHLALIDPELPAFVDADRSAREQEARYLSTVAARLSARSVQVDTSVEDDPVGGAIADAAIRVGADLITMATHGRTGLSRAWMGSAADSVVQRARVPVLLVRPRDHDQAAPESDERNHQERLFRRILIPLDGSERAEAILPHAVALGAPGQASYVLARVCRLVSVPAHPYTYAAEGSVLDAEMQRVEVAQAQQYLDGIADRVRNMAPGSSVVTEAWVHDRPALAILDRARFTESDLVALTTTGHGLTRLVLGSVADKVLRASDLPVLLFRPPAPNDATPARSRAAA